ncbi:PREDICTED: uncharacterized protein LOC108358010 [Rhagoletis zephyria]|uniref:uncharacterized protein LOC108358010 n=1 Tax=Rhagoletis zephyria TaxID=28612 RepID=UPI0008116131|nr:PREDICTED: uncharacterized protein LOC108358010 [Rhagoletis zephyria]
MSTTNQQLRLSLASVLLLGVLANCCLALTAADSANKREQLLTTMIEEYLELTDFQLQHSKALVQKVLADGAVVQVQSELMNAERGIMENFVRQVEDKEQEEPPAKSNTANRFFYLIAKSLIYQEFEGILRRHDTTNPRRKFASENYLIERSLKKHGLANWQREVTQKQTEFMNKFVKEVDAYLAQLTPAQRNNEDFQAEKMQNWSAKMKTITNVEQRMETFKEFMRFFVKF